MFTLTEHVLIRAWKKCQFPIPNDDEMIFFGLRGCLPLDLEGTGFASEHRLVTHSYNHKNMRCTLGQWKPGSGIALFPGSTVPSVYNVGRARERGGRGTNMLMRGLYRYEKGMHKSGKPTGHQAFRQATWFPVRRTRDDLDYDCDDSVDFSYSYVWDNLHCGWKLDPSDEGFASAGCQVVAGYPQEQKIGPRADDGIVGPVTAAMLGLALPRADGSGGGGPVSAPGVAIPVEVEVDPLEESEETFEAPLPSVPAAHPQSAVDDLPGAAIEMIKYFEAGGDVTK